jgi:glycosyltransferase involved in cell wall biosynthesis
MYQTIEHFIVLGNVGMEGLPQREHALAKGLAQRGYNVTFIEPMRSYASVLRDGLGTWLFPFGVDKNKASALSRMNLKVVSPPMVPTFFRSSWTPRFDELLFRRWFQETFRHHDWTRTVLMVMQVHWWSGFVDRDLAPAQMILYDVCDDLRMASRNRRTLRRLENAEQRIAGDLNAVTFSAYEMRERVLKLFPNKPSCYIPNAVSRHLGEMTGADKGGKRKVIGFVGSLDHRWVDQDLLIAIAENFKKCALVLRGSPDRTFARRIAKHPNVTILPFVEEEKLGDVLNSLDVGLIPFKRNKITEVVNPLKLYEYSLFGIPVVATWTKELSHYDEIVHLARSREEFLVAIERALTNSTDERREKLREFALANTWDHRVDQLLEFAHLQKHADGMFDSVDVSTRR